MKLSAERIQENWNEFTHNIINYISSPRKEQLIEFYNKYQDRLILMPAAHKKEYHNAFPGGYIDHVNRVVKAALELSYIWDKLGEDYMFNNKVEFASVPDRGLFLLQSHGIKYNFNEMVAIQTHDGLYDSANDKYLKGWMPEQKPRTSLPFILHQADMMAARIEFEMEWLPKFKSDFKKSDNFTIKTNKSTKSKALSSISSPGLKDMLKKL